MRILLAPDSFKEAASAEAIAQAMARGIKRGNPQAECRLMPLSDGGEGLTQALVHATAGTLHNVETVDAIGRPITAQFGFLGNNHDSCILRTAVVELASASGLERVSPADRNALSASTFGTGLLIRAAIDAGANRIVLGLGGSATTDGGTGLARALGLNIAKRAEEYKPKERVTYKMIKEYIEAKYGFKVHTAYIAEVKRDLGLPMYDAPNAVEELKQPRKHPTAEKVEAIKDALKHFEII